MKHGRPQTFFNGGQRRHFAYPFQVAMDTVRGVVLKKEVCERRYHAFTPRHTPDLG